MPKSPLPYVALETLVSIAETHQTPTYVYDAALIKEKFMVYRNAFSERQHQIHYAVKANGNLSILKLLADLGAGFDVVSMGELQRVIMAGGESKKTIFSGVGKQIEEIAFALEVGIEAFDVESIAELHTIIAVAKAMDVVAPISVRFNPDVDAKTHPYISTGLKDNKFGLTAEQAIEAYRLAQSSPQIKIVGINMHIGSQINDLGVFADALRVQARFVSELKEKLNINLEHINMGGGIGVHYQNEETINIDSWAQLVKSIYPNNDVALLMEPGRSIVANAGILLTRVLYNKEQSGNHFTVVDAAMNDYARVALYQAHNKISNLTKEEKKPIFQSIVGPICESGDSFAKNRKLDASENDLLAIEDTGAYGFCMASNYNARNRPAEVLASRDGFELIRRRETFEEQIDAELIGAFEIEKDE